MQAWSTFYATIGAASATLLGLLFVAVSINAKAALGSGDRLTTAMTEQAFQNYLAVLLVALLALFPAVPPIAFGYLMLVAVAGRAVWVGIRFAQMVWHRGPRRPLLFALRRHASSVIGFGLLIVAATRMALGRGDDYNMLASATVVLLFSATTVSWELLRRIAEPPPE
jgi:hypothetical protein